MSQLSLVTTWLMLVRILFGLALHRLPHTAAYFIWCSAVCCIFGCFAWCVLCPSLLLVSGHEARQVHRAEFVVEVSHEAEEEGETLATCKVLYSMLRPSFSMSCRMLHTCNILFTCTMLCMRSVIYTQHGMHYIAWYAAWYIAWHIQHTGYRLWNMQFTEYRLHFSHHSTRRHKVEQMPG